MQIHSVSLHDFSDESYHLIGIHSTLEDYRLAYLMNSYLNVDLKRCAKDVDFKHKNFIATYSLYEYENHEKDTNWFLVTNVFKTKVATKSISLFAENETSVFLIPEKKKVDYFVKLEGYFSSSQVEEIVDIINKIPQVITSYKIDTNALKSKDYLIF